MGDWAKGPRASASRSQSSSVKLPWRTDCMSTCASPQSMRLASCSRGISREKKATVLRATMAACCAMLSMKAVLPIEGRAPTRMNSPPWKPVVNRSSSAKPEGTPWMRPLLR